MKRDEGFTLVELLVSVTVSAVILFGAMTLLLLGFRIQSRAQADVEELQSTRILYAVLEKVGAGGQVDARRDSPEGWQLLGAQVQEGDGTVKRPVLLEYREAEGTLYAGGSPVLTGLAAAESSLDGRTGMLRLSLTTTRQRRYEAQIYCRTPVSGELTPAARTLAPDSTVWAMIRAQARDTRPDQVQPPEPETTADCGTQGGLTAGGSGEKAARYGFLKTLADQADSHGEIVGTDHYFSEWYIGGYGPGHPGWNRETPWCACFLSWAAARNGSRLGAVPRFADVDDGMAWFRGKNRWRSPGEVPVPGDFIFFDWSGGQDPDHVGAVLYVDGGRVHTVEGNSGGQVATRSYDLKDSRITGYGVLDWK